MTGRLTGFTVPSGNPDNRGYSLMEVIIAIMLLAGLFSVAYSILSYANTETQKGYWLQQRITDLRNATRAISLRMKKTSYPSTIVRQGKTDVVVSFKEWRRFDDSSRLRDMQVNPSTDFDMNAVEGSILPGPSPTSIMRFPLCTPEKDGQPGVITWVELLLQPKQPFIPERPRGKLVLLEREETYTTTAPMFAFALHRTFPSTMAPCVEKEIAEDVSQVRIASFSSDELRGIMVSESGAVAKKFRRRYLVSVRIDCSHPRDDKITISDQCTVVANVDLTAIAGGMNLLVNAIHGSGPTASADVLFNGTPLTLVPGSKVGADWSVTQIFATGIVLRHTLTATTRTFYKKK
ncbi:MAG: prepilin-type N-terminal cleavage/methylation domain-containing protein [Candidatus Ozemobacteraceae bacterium]